MKHVDIEKLPRKTLVKLLRAYSRNWQTLDGQWFGNVEAACGLDTAVRLDLKNWEVQAATEATRILKALDTSAGGLSKVLTVLSLMSWQLTSPLFEVESESEERIVFFYRQCAVQEGRAKRDKPVFPCKRMKLTLLSGIASVAEPRAHIRCISCPPDPSGQGYWCKWELTLGP